MECDCEVSVPVRCVSLCHCEVSVTEVSVTVRWSGDG